MVRGKTGGVLVNEVVMPKMGYDMTEGTIVRWRKDEGDEVTRGEVIAEVDTTKVTVEVEAYTAGVLRKILVPEGQTVPVGHVIAVITDRDEPIPGLEAKAAPAEKAAPVATGAPTPTAGPTAPRRTSATRRSTPTVSSMASCSPATSWPCSTRSRTGPA